MQQQLLDPRPAPSRSRSRLVLVSALALLAAAPAPAADDPLPSWKDTAPRKAIVAFVERVTRTGSADFVPEPERVAVFDNDGTLWCEQPMYFQVMFVADRVKALAPKRPEWKTQEPFASVLKGDFHAVAATGEKGLMELIAATHAGMTTEDFSRTVSDWVATGRHPKTGKLYTEMAYQPMLELLHYLRANEGVRFLVGN